MCYSPTRCDAFKYVTSQVLLQSRGLYIHIPPALHASCHQRLIPRIRRWQYDLRRSNDGDKLKSAFDSWEQGELDDTFKKWIRQDIFFFLWLTNIWRKYKCASRSVNIDDRRLWNVWGDLPDRQEHMDTAFARVGVLGRFWGRENKLGKIGKK